MRQTADVFATTPFVRNSPESFKQFQRSYDMEQPMNIKDHASQANNDLMHHQMVHSSSMGAIAGPAHLPQIDDFYSRKQRSQESFRSRNSTLSQNTRTAYRVDLENAQGALNQSLNSGLGGNPNHYHSTSFLKNTSQQRSNTKDQKDFRTNLIYNKLNHNPTSLAILKKTRNNLIGPGYSAYRTDSLIE